MIHRIMLAAALLAVPGIVLAERPAPATTAHPQQPDTSKGKAAATRSTTSAKGAKGKKKGKSAKKRAAKPAAAAATDTGKSK